MFLSFIQIILIVFSAGVLLYLFELAWIYGGISVYKSNAVADYATPVSLIIAARDEEQNLRKNLLQWLEQDHHAFEVIVVNDCSFDNSIYLLKDYQRRFPHLQIINLEESAIFKGGKKQALFLAIKGAQFERLIFTDADCRPASKDWLALMNAQFDDQKEIVLGMGSYEKSKGLLNYLIRMDTVQIAIQYLGAASRKFPYMGVGRNLGYKKNLYLEHGGFRKHIDLPWGDDDLLINEMANGKNTALCLIPEAQTVSKPKKTFGKWFRQKRRHMTTSQRYKAGTRLVISLKPLRMLLYYPALLTGLFIPALTNSFIISASIMYLAHIMMLHLLKTKIGKVDKFFVFPLTEIALFVLNILIYVSVWTKKPKNWN